MELEDELKERFPYGHPRYVDLTLEELELHNAKNHDFAGGGDPLGNFYRTSIIKKLYPGFDWDSPFGSAIGLMLKQFDSMMWLRSQKIEAKVEGIPARLKDITIYMKLAILLYEEELSANK